MTRARSPEAPAEAGKPTLETPESVDPTLVTDAAELARWCRRWRRCDAVAVDTEFVRERTFYPILGLVQLNDGDEVVLVDPVAIDDLAPLGELLADPSVTKVMHSCGEDLEVFYHRFGHFPEPVFDTQIGAALAGLGFSLGYASLVAELCGVELPKGETRSNWVRRPLRDSQLRYAAWDVVYLLPAYRKLEAELRRRGREGWVEEEVAELFDAERFLPDPETAYLQAAHSSMSRRELAILRNVAGWRERQARKRDLPRNFVLPQRALPEIARRKPRDRRQLASVSGLRDADRKRHGKTLLRLVAEAVELPDSELPPKLRRPVDLAPHRREVDRLRKAVARKAEELDLPPELLATRRVAEGMVRRAHGDDGPVVPESTTPWRRRILAELAERVLAPADL